MVQNTLSSEFDVIESQIRECYGRVCYSQKTHEKMTDLCVSYQKRIKLAEIILSALTTTSLLYTLLESSQASTNIATFCSAVLFCVTLYTKEYNLGEIAQKHTEAANKLWFARESFLSLLVDIKNKISYDVIRDRRDKLNESLSAIYMGSPRTNGKAYKLAKKALKRQEELTFSDEELDEFLPASLRKKKET